MHIAFVCNKDSRDEEKNIAWSCETVWVVTCLSREGSRHITICLAKILVNAKVMVFNITLEL